MIALSLGVDREPIPPSSNRPQHEQHQQILESQRQALS